MPSSRDRRLSRLFPLLLFCSDLQDASLRAHEHSQLILLRDSGEPNLERALVDKAIEI